MLKAEGRKHSFMILKNTCTYGFQRWALGKSASVVIRNISIIPVLCLLPRAHNLNRAITDANAKNIERVSIHTKKTQFVALSANIAVKNLSIANIMNLTGLKISANLPTHNPDYHKCVRTCGLYGGWCRGYDLLSYPKNSVQVVSGVQRILSLSITILDLGLQIAEVLPQFSIFPQSAIPNLQLVTKNSFIFLE